MKQWWCGESWGKKSQVYFWRENWLHRPALPFLLVRKGKYRSVEQRNNLVEGVPARGRVVGTGCSLKVPSKSNHFVILWFCESGHCWHWLFPLQHHGKSGTHFCVCFPQSCLSAQAVNRVLMTCRGQRVSFPTNDVAHLMVFWHIEAKKAWEVFLKDKFQSHTFCFLGQSRDNYEKFGNV